MINYIDYGKYNVTFYRSYAKPLRNIPTIPESPFAGRDNILFAIDVDVKVLGENFVPAYTEGDNSMVVATDSMKNFVYKQALGYKGATLEGFLNFLGHAFLSTYPEIEGVEIYGREQPFRAATVPQADSSTEPFTGSEVLFSRSHDDYSYAEVALERGEDGPELVDHLCGRHGLELIKVTGSSFASFVRDEHTTLPEMTDRPLFIHMDVGWRYTDPQHMLEPEHAHYVPAEQLRDLIQVTFHDFNSRSIQHLVYEMGTRVLGRFPQLAEVSFEAQNRLWDTALVDDSNDSIRVYHDPRPPYGNINLVMSRDDEAS